MTRSPAVAKSPAGPTEQPMGRRERQRIRSAILDAALELFAEQGYAATTIDQIAERAKAWAVLKRTSAPARAGGAQDPPQGRGIVSRFGLTGAG